MVCLTTLRYHVANIGTTKKRTTLVFLHTLHRSTPPSISQRTRIQRSDNRANAVDTKLALEPYAAVQRNAGEEDLVGRVSLYTPPRPWAVTTESSLLEVPLQSTTGASEMRSELSIPCVRACIVPLGIARSIGHNCVPKLYDVYAK